MTIKLEILNELLKYDYQKEFFKSLENNFDIKESDKTLELVRLIYTCLFKNLIIIRLCCTNLSVKAFLAI